MSDNLLFSCCKNFTLTRNLRLIRHVISTNYSLGSQSKNGCPLVVVLDDPQIFNAVQSGTNLFFSHTVFQTQGPTRVEHFVRSSPARYPKPAASAQFITPLHQQTLIPNLNDHTSNNQTNTPTTSLSRHLSLYPNSLSTP